MASILNNLNSGGINRQIGNSEAGLNRTLNRFATGQRINRASDDAAGLQIAQNLRADLRIFSQARQNVNTGLGITNIADGALSSASELLGRASEIATQAASGTTSQAGREALDSEFQEILGQLDSLGVNTQFDGRALFGENVSVRAGETDGENIDIELDALSAGDLGLSGADLLSEGNASTAIDAISGAIEQLSAQRGSLGASQQRLNTSFQSLAIKSENIQAAESQITDADVAQETVNLTKFQILSQSGVSAQAQSNLQQQNILNLLNG